MATQEQAFNALLFLCRHVLHIEIHGLGSTIRSRRPRRLPVVLSPMEAQGILEALSGRYRRMAMLMYGCGLRLEECLSLRVMDIDFDEGTVTVRAGKGRKDRIRVLPRALHEDLHAHLADLNRRYERGRAHRAAGVDLPPSVANRSPGAGAEWKWYWLFPSSRASTDPRSATPVLYHLHPSQSAWCCQPA